MPRPKTSTHELVTWIEIPIRVHYTHQPYEPDGRTSPGCSEKVSIDEIALESDLDENRKRSPVKTLEELMAYIGAEFEEDLTEECWEDWYKKQPPEED